MTADSARLADVVRDIVAELSHTTPAEIQGTDRLREDLGLDSLQSMELLSRVSETFDIDPDMEQVMGVETVDGVVAALQGHLAS